MSELGYVSTRGAAPRLGFADVLLAGLAPDGGLYVPEHLAGARSVVATGARTGLRRHRRRRHVALRGR